MLVWLSVWSNVQTCIWSSWCHCHSLSVASVKSRLVLPVWYWLTWVVPEKGPLNGCVCVCVCCGRIRSPSHLFIYGVIFTGIFRQFCPKTTKDRWKNACKFWLWTQYRFLWALLVVADRSEDSWSDWGPAGAVSSVCLSADTDGNIWRFCSRWKWCEVWAWWCKLPSDKFS